uniref:Retinol binding protein 7a, cellular n=1 Tax=Fundulus heteroclitus TaxID=8078 RepID=A0A3Q2QFN4_FUNHE
MPTSLCGTWDMISNVNFEGYMRALGISACLRKIALKLKLRKVIEQQGDQYLVKTLSTFKNYTISFKIDQEFGEFTKGLDNRHIKVRMDVRKRTAPSVRVPTQFCVAFLINPLSLSFFFSCLPSVQSTVTWQGSKLTCEQTGEKKSRGWAHWVEDDKLHLELYCEGEVCKQVFKRNE